MTQLSWFELRVLRDISTNDPRGRPSWLILDCSSFDGGDIARALQKLKRHGLAKVVSKKRGVTWWKAIDDWKVQIPAKEQVMV